MSMNVPRMSKAPGMGNEIWQQYEQGVDYKTRIGLYRTVVSNLIMNDTNVIVK